MCVGGGGGGKSRPPVPSLDLCMTVYIHMVHVHFGSMVDIMQTSSWMHQPSK